MRAIECKKSLVEFTAAQGAGQHCEILNRSLFNRVAFDWLDGTPGGVDERDAQRPINGRPPPRVDDAGSR